MAFTYSGDANWKDYASPSNFMSKQPVTMAAAATIIPVSYLTILTGTTQVATIQVPYAGFSGTIALLFTDGSPGATLTTGNIALATTVVQNKPVLMTYNPIAAKWYPSY